MSTEIQALQHDRLEAQKFIEQADKLKKLKANASFKDLFLKQYCEEDVTRLVGTLAHVADDDKPKLVAELEAISRFKMHMNFIEQMGHAAVVKIVEIDEALAEIQLEA